MSIHLKKKIYPIKPIYTTLYAQFANFATIVTEVVPDLPAKGPLAPRAGTKHPFLPSVDRYPELGKIPRNIGIGHDQKMD
jgi:hypothetical protein